MTKHQKNKSVGSTHNTQDNMGTEVKPLVDLAIDCARNMDFRAAKEALQQAKKRLEP